MLLFQKWQHNLEQFERLSTKEQEDVIGRTKAEGDEMNALELLSTSHVARTTLLRDEEELPIFRRNVSYGTTTNHGTVFIGFSSEQYRLQEMVRRMAGIPDGIRDALTKFTTPLSGSYYLVPPADSIRRFATQVKFLTK